MTVSSRQTYKRKYTPNTRHPHAVLTWWAVSVVRRLRRYLGHSLALQYIRRSTHSTWGPASPACHDDACSRDHALDPLRRLIEPSPCHPDPMKQRSRAHPWHPISYPPSAAMVSATVSLSPRASRLSSSKYSPANSKGIGGPAALPSSLDRGQPRHHLDSDTKLSGYADETLHDAQTAHCSPVIHPDRAYDFDESQ